MILNIFGGGKLEFPEQHTYLSELDVPIYIIITFALIFVYLKNRKIAKKQYL